MEPFPSLDEPAKDGSCNVSCCDNGVALPNTGAGRGKDDPDWLLTAGLVGSAAAAVGAKLLRVRETRSE